MKKHFGKRLKELRAQFGYTQKRLAQEIGLERSNYVRVEGGYRPATNTFLQKIADIYDVPIEPLQVERDACLIKRKYSVEAIRLACRYLDEETPG